ncbi:hypothetical protein ABVK25_009541 [Lepraria finkii]|uniref:Uncharacterized protein n=1 Tax=Lepraria finkii TaxID=1340010 RepID=A0ABR4AWZ3_9LECA
MEAWSRKRITALGSFGSWVRILVLDQGAGCWMGYIVDDMPYSYMRDSRTGWLGALFGSRWVFMKKIFTIIAHTLVLLSCSVYRLCGALYPASSEKRCTIRYHRRSPISLKLITLTSLASSMRQHITTKTLLEMLGRTSMYDRLRTSSIVRYRKERGLPGQQAWTDDLLKDSQSSSSSSSSSSSHNDEAPTLSKLLPSSTLNVANSI